VKKVLVSVGILLVLASSAHGQQFSSQGQLQTPVEQQESNQTLELPAQFKGCWSGVYSMSEPGFGTVGGEEMQLCFTPSPTFKGVSAKLDKVGPGWVQLEYTASGKVSFIDYQEAGKIRCRLLTDSGRVSCDGAGVRTQKINPPVMTGISEDAKARMQQAVDRMPLMAVPINWSVTMDKE
jgi:hypothetical protein